MLTNKLNIKTTFKAIHNIKTAAKTTIITTTNNRHHNFINRWLLDNHLELVIRDKARIEDEKLIIQNHQFFVKYSKC